MSIFRKIHRTLSLNRTLILYIAAALVPFLFLTVFAARSTESSLTASAQELTDYRTIHVAEILNRETESLFDVIYSTLNNTSLKQHFSRFSKNENREYAASQIKSEFKIHTTLNPNLSQCVFLSPDGSFVNWQNYRPENSDIIWNDASFRENAFRQVLQSSRAAALPSPEPDQEFDGTPVVYVGIPVSISADRTLGILLFGIKKAFFRSSFFENEETSPENLPEILDVAHYVLADDTQTILYMNDSMSEERSLTEYVKDNQLTDDRFVITETPLKSLGWKLYTYFPRSVVFRSARQETKRNYLLVILYAFLLIYVSIVIVSHQNRRIKKVAEGIQGFHGNEKNYQIEPFPNQHLNIIINQFNLMASRIFSLTESIREEQKKSREEMDLRRKAELRSLEMQINPHFLYNTLDTINWMAIDKDEMEISNMLGALGSLLRYSVTNIDQPVLIRAEAEWIRKYLLLQEKRFGDLFTWSLELELGVENRIIYKMLLQPIIENSILHGFCDRTEGGQIRIQIGMAENSMLFIRICDNGCGLPEKTLEEFRTIIRHPGVYPRENIGFFNVVSRLHAYYHDQFRMEIGSENGTQTTIYLPQ